MRTNPKYSNICWNRIGMYKEHACYDCKMLGKCDIHYNDDGTWDYTGELTPRKKTICVKVKNKLKTRSPATKARRESQHLDYLVRKGRASKIPVTTTLEEALVIAGLK